MNLRLSFQGLKIWLNNESVSESQPNQKFNWVQTLPFIALHLGCLAVFWVGVSSIALEVLALTYGLRMFAITGFYHRYFSHKTFETNRIIQFIFAFLGASSAQRGPLWWASHHRVHHRYADTDKDPHSPKIKGFIWSHFSWFFSPDAFKTDNSLIPDLLKFPELRWLNRSDMFAPALLALSLFILGHHLNQQSALYHTSGAQLLVWGFFISTGLLFHATSSINSLAHLIGHRSFTTPDSSRNNFVLALITLGEGWHNNHHFYPASARQGFRWWQIDITYYLLWLMSQCRIIRNLRPVRLDRGRGS